jgi:hypothetical protein
MSCPYNPFGQPACNIVAHPDRPGESFCASCSRRFYDPTPVQSPDAPVGFLDFLIRVVLTLIIGAVLTAKLPNVEVPLPLFNSPPTRGPR